MNGKLVKIIRTVTSHLGEFPGFQVKRIQLIIIYFSAGPRNCIGQKFAVLEMKSLVSKVLRNFEISMDPSYRKPILIAEIILKPENGIFLNLKKRE